MLVVVEAGTCQEDGLTQSNKFETITTANNLGKPLQQQQLRCKTCMEQVSGRPERMKEHLAKCFKAPNPTQVR